MKTTTLTANSRKPGVSRKYEIQKWIDEHKAHIVLWGYYAFCAIISVLAVLAYRKIPWLNEFAKKQCMWLYGWKSIQ